MTEPPPIAAGSPASPFFASSGFSLAVEVPMSLVTLPVKVSPSGSRC